jgi:cytochrome c-type biogenesis protein CcmF
MSFQVILPTSIPAWNALVESFGGISNMAPPADQVGFYTKFQLWFAVVLALLTSVGQFFWWQKIDRKTLGESLVVPYVISIILSTLVIVLAKVNWWGELASNWKYIIIVFAGMFTIVANATILVKLLKKSTFKLAGGSFAHIGLGMILIGIMFSSGYSEVISMNMSGLTYSNSWEDEMNKEHVLLWINKPTQMKDYTVIYRGRQKKAVGIPEYVPAKILASTGEVNEAIALEDYNAYFKKGDTIQLVLEENDYFKIDYLQNEALQFSLSPMSQYNEGMGGLISSPDSKIYLNKDLYTYVAAMNDFADPEWKEDETYEVSKGEQFHVADFVAYFDGAEVLKEIDGYTLKEGDVAVKAKIRVLDYDVEKLLEPTFIIRDNQVGKLPVIDSELGIKISLENILPEQNKFVFKVNQYQKDYVVMKAIVKPYINVLWIGTIVMLFGFTVAIYRRFDEFVKMRDKGIE